MKDIYEELTQLFTQGRTSILATIVRQGGSAPRGIGAKCLILDDGSLVGTIGGGLLEGETIKEARRVFDSGRPRRLRFVLKGTDVAETDMLCGGEVEVFLEPVPPGKLSHLAIFEEITKIHSRGGAGLLATIIDDDKWLFGDIPKVFLDREGRRTGALLGDRELENALSDEMEHILTTGLPTILSMNDKEGKQIEIFVEPVVSTPVLYVFRGGHVSRQLVPLADRVGFQVIVTDDRREFADSGEFPCATEVCHCPFEGVIARLPVNESSYLVIVTRGHMHDKNVLTQALSSKARYIGMIGSSRKRKIIFDRLLEEGYTKEDLLRVHSPIGLDIGAETPEEIAVSIVAELIQVRAGKD